MFSSHPGKALSACAFSLLAALAAHPAGAQSKVLFDTFGSSGAYDTNAAVPVQGADQFPGYTAQADAFTVHGGSYTLNQIDAAFSAGNVTGPEDALTLTLQTSNANNIPSGDILETWQVSGFGSFAGSNVPVSVQSSLHPVLNSGQLYWLVAAPTDSLSEAEWHFTDTSAVGPAATDSGSGWSRPGTGPELAFDVYGTHKPMAPVPEASTFVSFGLALLFGGGLGLTARKRARPSA